MHSFLTPLDHLARLRPWDLLIVPKAHEPAGLISYFTTPALMSALPCKALQGTLCIMHVCSDSSVMFVGCLLEAIPSLVGHAGAAQTNISTGWE